LQHRQEAGTLPASILVAFGMVLGGCGSPVTPSPVATQGYLSCADYQSNVNFIFEISINGVRCMTCHAIGSASGNTFKIYENAQPNTPEMQTNFERASSGARVNLANPEQSLLLLKPIGDPTVGHFGGAILTRGDVYYTALLTWISNQSQVPSACYP
jgi:hypothetical protein